MLLLSLHLLKLYQGLPTLSPFILGFNQHTPSRLSRLVHQEGHISVCMARARPSTRQWSLTALIGPLVFEVRLTFRKLPLLWILNKVENAIDWHQWYLKLSGKSLSLDFIRYLHHLTPVKTNGSWTSANRTNMKKSLLERIMKTKTFPSCQLSEL